MKTILDITKKIFGLLVFSSLLFSCSEDALDKVNQDNDHTKDVEAKYILADVITATAFRNIGGDLSTYASVYIEHEVGIHNQLYRAEMRSTEPSAATTFNNVWLSLYDALKNTKIIIEKCSEGGSQEGNQITKGIAEVLAAYNSALIADMFGDAPWSEAGVRDEHGRPLYMTPKIDKQEDIYKGVINYLDAAIADLQGSDEHLTGSVGSYDLLYNGDANKWLKLAYGLKARYTMRLLAKTSDMNTELDNVLSYLNNSFTSVSDQAAFNVYDATNLNPLFDFQWSRDGLAASESMSDKLIERNDPRLRRVFVDAGWSQVEGADAENFGMASNGAVQEIQYYYNTSTFVYSQIASTLFLSYHEVLFLKAEAHARKGELTDAENALEKAIAAAIANTEESVKAAMNAPAILTYGGLEETTTAITPAEAATYFTTSVKPLFDANPLKEVMIQKYIAFFGASGEATECYNDVRRLQAMGDDFITLANPKNAEGKFPLRCPYGNSDTTANPNVQEAYGNGQYIYTEPVWWAGGTR
ncbi:SusD/RagB family nutrient-binding outer membrane lipoprotein [Paludibacter sp. 221]|uniref:SusD/RagB family nutrient-binding outer membrane lipoprotein n=1 Tax=Paludibacter sp. 221 TaxID=2302939 RepID=UPI0013D3B020|nr:SusD/RagB family nutrient-binding outer membrane lipoprotein [Paludibacter sp. 221]NDV45913.1 SusD/RagB family nutrient-binding outer membrane lipoprotein [Paludibacter sp. 221]